jgi:predicted DsbA family dithiol-disulfide isomerase
VKRIWRDDAFYQDLCRKVEKEAVQHDLARNTERFVRAVGPFVLASKGLGADGKPLPKTAAGMLQQALKKKQAQPQTKPRAKKRR